MLTCELYCNFLYCRASFNLCSSFQFRFLFQFCALGHKVVDLVSHPPPKCLPLTKMCSVCVTVHDSKFRIVAGYSYLPLPFRSIFNPSHTYPALSMAAQQAADVVKEAVQTVADGVKNMTAGESNTPNTVLDEVTGEHVSKTEFKKRQKQREKEKQKAEREATRQAPPPPKKKTGGAAAEEEELNPNVWRSPPLKWSDL